MSIEKSQDIINRKMKIMKLGHTQDSLASAAGIKPQVVSRAFHGKVSSIVIYKKIAAVVGETLVGFWPDIFNVIPSHDSNINNIHDSVNYKEGAAL
jgi:transcriptional regulator with XRE-family HTH domain